MNGGGPIRPELRDAQDESPSNTAGGTPRGVAVILVENLSVPFDRRVWQEASALADAGFEVFVICPRGGKRDTEARVQIGGVKILRYALRPASGGPRGYLREYSVALARTAQLLCAVARRRRIDVLHACNPPDLLLLLALPLKATGTRFVFDHHDLVPELFESRFGGRGPLRVATLALERLTFACADMVISTNESYRRVAIERGNVPPDRVRVVRSAPDLRRFRPVAPEPGLKAGKPYLLAYLGVMGPQDGIDHALRAIAVLHEERQDFRAVFMGDGDVLPEMRGLSLGLGLGDVIEFTGRVSDADVIRYLSTADVCLAPDPKSPLNDVSTMNKIVEYMAMGRPIVSFDLVEARVSAEGAAVYARPNDEREFARAISGLLDDPGRREAMGALGKERVARALSWSHSKKRLLEAYSDLVGGGSESLGARRAP